MSPNNVWAVIPVKETAFAKQRLGSVFSQEFRRRLALTMFEDTIRAVSAVSVLSGVVVVTIDPTAANIAARYGAQVWSEGAQDGHTGAVSAAAHRLAQTNATLLTMPGDIPLVTAADIQRLLGERIPVRLVGRIALPPHLGDPERVVSRASNGPKPLRGAQRPDE